MEHDIYMPTPMGELNGYPPEMTPLEEELTRKIASMKIATRDNDKFLHGCIRHAAANLGVTFDHLISAYDDYLKEQAK